VKKGNKFTYQIQTQLINFKRKSEVVLTIKEGQAMKIKKQIDVKIE
jgi:hypothetical protein